MWYSVEALFRCDVSGESDNILYDRKIFLIDVDGDKQKASKKAKQQALSFETAYKNFEGGDVSWHFVKVLEVQNLSEEKLYDGVEVFSRLVWGTEIADELHKSTTVARKNKRLKDKTIKVA